MKKVLTALLLVLSVLTACCIFASAASSQGETAEPYVLQPGEYYKCDHTPVKITKLAALEYLVSTKTYSYRQLVYPEGHSETFPSEKGHTCLSYLCGNNNQFNLTVNADEKGKSGFGINIQGTTIIKQSSHGQANRKSTTHCCSSVIVE